MDNEIYKKLHNAIAAKDTEAVRQLMHNSDQQPCYDKYILDQLLEHKWSLRNVVLLRKPNITKLLLESDDSINVNEHNEYEGWTALHQAAYNIDVDHVKLLLDHKADPNYLNADCHSPLYYIYQDYQDDAGDLNYNDTLQEIAVMLIDRGAKATITRNNVSHLQIEPFLEWGNRKAVELALKQDVNLRVHYQDGDTVLHFLASNDNDEQVLTVIRGRDFDVNARNDEQQTPLWAAARNGNVHAIEFLLSEDADPNIPDEDNCTPLYIAMYESEESPDEYKKCIALLLEYGADVQIASTRDDEPATVFDLATLDDNEDCYLYRLMLEHLALQEVSGAKITELIQSKIDLSDSSKKYYNHCKMLLAKKAYESDTMLKLLSCSDEKMVLYMRNEEMVRIINDLCNELKLMSVAYGDLLEKRFKKAKGTAKLRGEVVPVISKLIDVDYDYYFSIVDMIVRFLNERDLNTLLNV